MSETVLQQVAIAKPIRERFLAIGEALFAEDGVGIRGHTVSLRAVRRVSNSILSQRFCQAVPVRACLETGRSTTCLSDFHKQPRCRPKRGSAKDVSGISAIRPGNESEFDFVGSSQRPP